MVVGLKMAAACSGGPVFLEPSGLYIALSVCIANLEIPIK